MKKTPKSAVKPIGRPKRSFLPVDGKIVHPFSFKGIGAKYLGNHEPDFPPLDIQFEWTRDQREMAIGNSLNWYANTATEDKALYDSAMLVLGMSGNGKQLVDALDDSSLQLPRVACALIHMAGRGLKLNFKEGRRIVKAIRASLNALDEKKIAKKLAGGSTTAKPTIQDHISAKLRIAKGEIDAVFDSYLNSGCKRTDRTVMNVLLDPKISVPATRTKDLVEFANNYIAEFKAAGSGTRKNEDFAEAYDYLGKRGLKNCIEWWENAITDINTFGKHKASNRKTRKKKAVPTTKLVGKLKFIKEFKQLGLVSIDPASILKCTELWVYNTKLRKIGRYVALNGCTLDVKKTRLTNLDTVKCVQKTLRKPADQLKEFNSYGKPGAIKWFNNIHAVATPLREAINADSILLRAVK